MDGWDDGGEGEEATVVRGVVREVRSERSGERRLRENSRRSGGRLLKDGGERSYAYE
jgi:hypothetical protein